VSGVNVYSLPLSTKEGFVLSRVDGAASVEDISIMVGVKQDELLGILERLAALGAVKLPWSVPQRPVVAPVAMSGRAAASPTRATPDKPKPAPPIVEEAARYDPLELEEAVQISLDVKKRILNAYYSLEGKDYYQVLGVARDVDKKVIRHAYFDLSKVFHPDSLFGKELGSFKPKMEAVFKRLTEAYEALGRAPRRKEYDEYLAATVQTSALQKTLAQVQREAEHVRRPHPPANSSASAPATEAPPAPEPRRAVVPPPMADARVERISLRPPATPDERKALARERLRRHLGADAKRSSSPPSDKPPSVAPPSSGSARERRDSAIKGLRQSLRASGHSTGGSDKLIAYLKQAKHAETAGDLMGAASALQSAMALDPESREIQEQYERVSKAVTRSLADNYEKQARYEEKMGKWAAAALSWERVVDGRPEDFRAAHAAAEALLKASGDMHKAQHHAQRAVDLRPSDVSNVVLLARVYLAAGLRLNARRELEKAVKLDPHDEMIKNLLSEAR
jgi:curved DNA-binding protein CbpA